MAVPSAVPVPAAVAAGFSKTGRGEVAVVLGALLEMTEVRTNVPEDVVESSGWLKYPEAVLDVTTEGMLVVAGGVA